MSRATAMAKAIVMAWPWPLPAAMAMAVALVQVLAMVLAFFGLASMATLTPESRGLKAAMALRERKSLKGRRVEPSLPEEYSQAVTNHATAPRWRERKRSKGRRVEGALAREVERTHRRRHEPMSER